MIKEPYATLLNTIVEIMKEEFKDDLISIVLYGSVSRGDNRNDSDVDLLIIMNNLPTDSIFKRIRMFETRVEDKLNLDKYWREGYYVSLSPPFSKLQRRQRRFPHFI
ncbi:hypothetical protein IC006_0898 [Sulfuracidifex tepidarius]|uniref:Polymerase nucleotidyl transferase domain-containing protein n=1 Tax=Sulfuracidifex tepidarius TaxID=1294262 RepID=A0A510DU71_9CREN|nr:hypothetical protein IC006_0898 [Sulfuracidifex tepidarius]